jgi:hypothetical protein
VVSFRVKGRDSFDKKGSFGVEREEMVGFAG